METLFAITLFGATAWFWISFVLFIIICFISDLRKDGFIAFFFLLLFSVLYYFWGDVKPLLEFLTLKNCVLYFTVGLGFAIIRSFFSARTLGREIKDLPKTRNDIKGQSHVYDNQEDSRNRFLDKLKNNVFRWWFMWPISMITWVISDIIKDVYDFIYDKIKGLFEFVVDLGIKSVK